MRKYILDRRRNGYTFVSVALALLAYEPHPCPPLLGKGRQCIGICTTLHLP